MVHRLLAALLLAAALTACTAGATSGTTPPATLTTIPPVAAATSTIPPPTTVPPTTTTTTTAAPGIVTPESLGQPWGEVTGLTMFRGNPTHTFHGTGPIPNGLEVLWRFPDRALCGSSPVGGENKVWCGTGWTGQPVVWERPDGHTEVIFGAYDKNVHFLDAATGARLRDDFYMGDIIKGSVMLDPDGFPLLYVGSRDSRYRIVALDRDQPTELWALDAASVAGMWNNDWDSSAVVVDDVLLEGGENSWWFAVKLNRQRDETGLVTIDPQILYETPVWTDELLRTVGRQHSIEDSTAVFDRTAYVATGAGRVLGFDLDKIEAGEDPIVLDFWMGDDVDASIVIDASGMLYVASEVDLATARGKEIGQLAKLDPNHPDDPLVWSIPIPGSGSLAGGIWATPALADGALFVLTNAGEVLSVDTADGTVIWRDEVGGHAWSSPVLIDDTLVVAVDCFSGSGFRAYDVSNVGSPQRLWESSISTGCIESTPAVWDGRFYVGSRDGYFYALGAG
jgi:outer membrane protein assembly factor BamB